VRAISLAQSNKERQATMKRFEISTTLRVVLRKETEADALKEVEQLVATLEQFQSFGEGNYDEDGIETVEFGEPEVLNGE
jgi:hypothetical protein